MVCSAEQPLFKHIKGKESIFYEAISGLQPIKQDQAIEIRYKESQPLHFLKTH